MTEPKDLLLINERLRRANRRWKALALAACAALVLTVLFGVASSERQRRQAEAAMREAQASLVRASAALNPGRPR
jgi:hypothetical protein